MQDTSLDTTQADSVIDSTQSAAPDTSFVAERVLETAERALALSDNPLIQALVVAGIVVVPIVIVWVLFLALKPIIHRQKYIEYSFILRLRLPLIFLVFGIIATSLVSLMPFSQDTKEVLYHGLKIWLIFSVALLIIRSFATIRESVMAAYDINAEDNLIARKRYTQFKVFQNIAVVIVVLIALALALMTFEAIREFGVSLLASAGVAGIVIGVSAQKLLSNLLAGFQIAITQPIRLDDAVLVENEFGWIEEINLTYVVVRIWDKRRLVVPTTHFIEKPFQNWTKTSADLLGPIFLWTDYTVPLTALRAEFDRIMEDHPLWDKKVKVIQVTNSTERALELRILVSAKNAPTTWDLRVDVREKLIIFLQENYPSALPRTRLALEGEQPKSIDLEKPFIDRG